MDDVIKKNRKFFNWLFSTEDIQLTYEEENVLIDDYNWDSNEQNVVYTPIYFPIQMKKFFESSAMQRLKKVLQLGAVVQINPYAIGTRYEHCLGAYNLKKNLIMDLYFNNADFCEMVERNGLKKYIIAELIKTAGHDIGHLPTSHQLEHSVLDEKGFHEYIGREILTNPNNYTGIDEAYRQINNGDVDEFKNIMSEVLTKDIFGFAMLDEGNIDIDRWDYLSRDLRYRHADQNQQWNIYEQKFPKPSFKCVDSNFNEVPMSSFIIQKNSNQIQLPEGIKIVPIFSENDIEVFNHILDLRYESYKNTYYHPYAQVREQSTGEVLRKIIVQNKTQTNSELLSFIDNLKKWRASEAEFDFESFIKWNDLTFFNIIYSCGIEASNEEDRKKIASAIPNYYSLLNILNSMLSTDKSKHSKDEQELLSRIKKVIKILQNPDTQECSLEERKMAEYVYQNYDINNMFDVSLEDSSNLPMQISFREIKMYSENDTPIYFLDSQGKIMTFKPSNNICRKNTVFWNWKHDAKSKSLEIVLEDAPVQGPICFRFNEER